MKKRLALIMVFVLLVSIFTPDVIEAKKKVKLSPGKVTISIGQKKKLVLKNNNKKVKWTVSKKKIVSLSKKGKKGVTVQGKKPGRVKVTAKIGKKKYICTVKVTKKKTESSSAEKTNNSAAESTAANKENLTVSSLPASASGSTGTSKPLPTETKGVTSQPGGSSEDPQNTSGTVETTSPTETTSPGGVSESPQNTEGSVETTSPNKTTSPGGVSESPQNTGGSVNTNSPDKTMSPGSVSERPQNTSGTAKTKDPNKTASPGGVSEKPGETEAAVGSMQPGATETPEKKTYTISGTAKNKDGSLLAECDVYFDNVIYWEDDDGEYYTSAYQTTTDQNGKYTLPGVEEGEYVVRLGALQQENSKQHFNVDKNRIIDIQSETALTMLTGEFKDSEGTPLANVDVRFYNKGNSYTYSEPSFVTDKEGKAKQWLPENTEYKVDFVDSLGYTYSYESVNTSDKNALQIEINTKTTLISGKVSLAKGTQLDNDQIQVYSLSKWRGIAIDDNGDYAFATFVGKGIDFLVRYKVDESSYDLPKLEVGNEETYNFDISQAYASVDFEVLCSNNKPVDDFTILAYSDEDYETHEYTIYGKDGKCSKVLPSGSELWIKIRIEDKNGWWNAAALAELEAGKIVAGDNQTKKIKLDFSLVRLTGILKLPDGTVLDNDTINSVHLYEKEDLSGDDIRIKIGFNGEYDKYLLSGKTYYPAIELGGKTVPLGKLDTDDESTYDINLNNICGVKLSFKSINNEELLDAVKHYRIDVYEDDDGKKGVGIFNNGHWYEGVYMVDNKAVLCCEKGKTYHVTVKGQDAGTFVAGREDTYSIKTAMAIVRGTIFDNKGNIISSYIQEDSPAVTNAPDGASSSAGAASQWSIGSIGLSIGENRTSCRDGKYEILLESGQYDVTVRVGETSYAAGKLDVGDPDSYDITVDAAFEIVKFNVTNKGKPFDGRLSVSEGDAGKECTKSYRNAGTYYAYLESGKTYQVKASFVYEDGIYYSDYSTVGSIVTAGKDVYNIDFNYEKVSYSVKDMVGESVTSGTLLFYSENKDGTLIAKKELWESRQIFVESGTTVVVVKKGDWYDEDAVVATWIVGEKESYDIVLPMRYKISGRITGVNGKVLASSQLYMRYKRNDGGTANEKLTLDASGVYSGYIEVEYGTTGEFVLKNDSIEISLGSVKIEDQKTIDFDMDKEIKDISVLITKQDGTPWETEGCVYICDKKTDHPEDDSREHDYSYGERKPNFHLVESGETYHLYASEYDDEYNVSYIYLGSITVGDEDEYTLVVED